MTKNPFCVTLLCGVFLVQLPFAHAQVFVKDWDHTYGGNKNDLVSVVRQVDGSGFMIAGTSLSGISADKSESNYDTTLATGDFWLLRTDPSGSKIWDHRLGGSGSEIHIETIVLADGFLSGGHTFSPAGFDVSEENRDSTLQSDDYWIVKTDINGQKMWDHRFGGTLYETFGTVRQTADGGFLVAGSSFSGVGADKTEPSQGGWDFWLVRTDSVGTKLWDHRYGGTGDDFAISAEELSDGSFVVAGYSNSGIGGDKSEPCRGATDFWVIRINAQGQLLWDRTFGGSENDWLFSLAISGSSVLLGGQSFSPVSGDKSEPNHDATVSGSDRWIIKEDTSGAKIWDHTYGGDQLEDLSQVIPMSDGGFLLSGESYSQDSGDKTEPNLGIEQTWLLRADSAGIVVWDKTLFTLGHDESGFVIPDSFGCFVAVNFCTADSGGYKSEASRGYGDYFLLRMCPDSTVGISESGDATLFRLIPNPVLGNIRIAASGKVPVTSIVLVEPTGKTVRRFDHPVPNDGYYELAPGGVSHGLYFVRIQTSTREWCLPAILLGD